MSEVCGASADIHVSMSEFWDCIHDTGLIHLPMQGELFTWHNCSEGDRSLWKRLDRLLVNDAWLSQWPNSYYQSLNARTSDHSPLLIRGDDNTNYVSMFRFDNYILLYLRTFFLRCRTSGSTILKEQLCMRLQGSFEL
ncbi:UNVERIFIED_CONTAM: hypothetical protein Slati_3081800 [Sesamum latifolium]|uniref:Uncharacterized protein n=1 Tax=Sesamum latifolium TaxID=2727402 RepID=A0AAW2UTY7_9LAMI